MHCLLSCSWPSLSRIWFWLLFFSCKYSYIWIRLPEPSLLQAEQSEFSQPLLIQEMLQYLNHLSGPSWTHSSPCLSFTRELRTEPGIPDMFHQSWLEMKNHLPKSADSSLSHSVQDAGTIVQLSNIYSISILQNLLIKLYLHMNLIFLHWKPQLFTYMMLI